MTGVLPRSFRALGSLHVVVLPLPKTLISSASVKLSWWPNCVPVRGKGKKSRVSNFLLNK